LSTSSVTTDAYFTIPQGASLWDHLPIIFPKNKTLYVWAASVPVTAEVFYTNY